MGAMLPRADWGKCRMERHYPFYPTMNIWDLEAGDVTHIIADKESFKSTEKRTQESSVQRNELLYTIHYGKKLSKIFTPEEVRQKICQGEAFYNNVADVAAKSENTKPSMKARETFSACDITRECLSELDRTAVPLTSIIPMISLCRSVKSMNKTLSRMLKDLVPCKSGFSIFISLDAEKWSPQGNRYLMTAHHNYIVSTSAAPEIGIIHYLKYFKNWFRVFRLFFQKKPGNYPFFLNSLKNMK